MQLKRRKKKKTLQKEPINVIEDKLKEINVKKEELVEKLQDNMDADLYKLANKSLSSSDSQKRNLLNKLSDPRSDKYQQFKEHALNNNIPEKDIYPLYQKFIADQLNNLEAMAMMNIPKNSPVISKKDTLDEKCANSESYSTLSKDDKLQFRMNELKRMGGGNQAIDKVDVSEKDKETIAKVKEKVTNSDKIVLDKSKLELDRNASSDSDLNDNDDLMISGLKHANLKYIKSKYFPEYFDSKGNLLPKNVRSIIKSLKTEKVDLKRKELSKDSNYFGSDGYIHLSEEELKNIVKDAYIKCGHTESSEGPFEGYSLLQLFSDFFISNWTFYMIIILLFYFFIRFTVSFYSVTGLQIITSMSNSSFKFLHGLMVSYLQNKNTLFYLWISYIFYYIIFNNLIGLIPFSFTINSHLSIPLIISFLTWLGMFFLGILNYGKNYFSLFIVDGVPKLIIFFLACVEFISYCFRFLSLSLRLFANVVAGHILLETFYILLFKLFFLTNKNKFLNLFALIIPILFFVILFLFEMVICVLQGYIFAVLVLIYLKEALVLH